MGVTNPPPSFLSNKLTIVSLSNNRVEVDGRYPEKNFIAETLAPTTGASYTDDGTNGNINLRLEEASVILDPIAADPTFTTGTPPGTSNSQPGMPMSFRSLI